MHARPLRCITHAVPRETTAQKLSRTREIIAGLRKAYPDAHCELNYTNPLELLIATILSAQVGMLWGDWMVRIRR